MNTDREFEIWWKQKSNLPMVRAEESTAKKAFLAGIEVARSEAADRKNAEYAATASLVGALDNALDALWKEHGNGWQTPQERLIAELQGELNRLKGE